KALQQRLSLKSRDSLFFTVACDLINFPAARCQALEWTCELVSFSFSGYCLFFERSEFFQHVHRHWSGLSISDGPVVELGHGQEDFGRAGDECFVCLPHFLQRDWTYDHLVCNFQKVFSRDSHQDMLVRGMKYAIFHDKKVAAGAFAYPSVPVIEHVLGTEPFPIHTVPDRESVISRLDIGDRSHVL